MLHSLLKAEKRNYLKCSRVDEVDQGSSLNVFIDGISETLYIIMMNILFFSSMKLNHIQINEDRQINSI